MKKNLLNLRRKINKIDNEIFSLLEKRLLVSKKIGKLKKRAGLKIKDSGREGKIIKDKVQKYELNGDFIRKIYEIILKESRRVQK